MYLAYKSSKRLAGRNIYLLLFVAFTLSQAGCTKLVTVDPPTTNINSDNVFGENSTAISAITGMYSKMIVYLSSMRMSLVPALSADELTLAGGSSSLNTAYIPCFTNDIKPLIPGPADFSPQLYQLIFSCNSSIEGLIKSKDVLNPDVKQHLLGEAKFMRAFCYFYLVNYYGAVPLATTTDYKVNSNLSRSSVEKVYEQIVLDLKDAQSLLSDKFLTADLITPYAVGQEERIRPTKWAATALLARVYLYTKDWANAEAQATDMINNTSLFQMSTLDKTFIKNNTEGIWQLQPVGNPQFFSNTEDATAFIIPSTGPGSGSFYLTQDLLNAFESGDERMANWVSSVVLGTETYYFPYKYKLYKAEEPVNEYTAVFRLSEQYLIRAEARAEQNKVSDAASDLDVVRNRANLPNTTAATKEDLLPAILHENRIEFFTEWGHRWFDLKRRNEVDAVMNNVATQKGSTWNTNKQWFPFSTYDLSTDPNLVQNPGYN